MQSGSEACAARSSLAFGVPTLTYDSRIDWRVVSAVVRTRSARWRDREVVTGARFGREAGPTKGATAATGCGVVCPREEMRSVPQTAAARDARADSKSSASFLGTLTNRGRRGECCAAVLQA